MSEFQSLSKDKFPLLNYLKNTKEVIFPKAFALLPERMDTLPARAMLLAIGLQESRFEHRIQINGPAHGFWQFELGGGVTGVLNHPATKDIILPICDERIGSTLPKHCYDAIIDDDVLSCCFARLLLWTLPGRLPNQDERVLGWMQYIDAWRPGMPHRNTWDAFFDQAWKEVIT